MRLTKLEIRRGESWNEDTSKPLNGLVELTGSTGKQAIALSPGAINRIIAVIAVEVAETARANAAQVKTGMNVAMDEQTLIANDGKIE